MVRQGCVIAMGARDDRPDYDYTDGVELHVYGLDEGQAAACKVYGTDGRLAASFEVTMRGGRAEVVTDSQKPYTVVTHG